jgi:uDENN domain
LTPSVADCYPDMDAATFPNTIASYCFPEQCCGSHTALPLTFFTEVLTNGAGPRIYTAILIVHDPSINSSNEKEQILYIPK